MSYYNNREERLEYQKEYHELNHDKYLNYQQWYYINVIKPNRIKKVRGKKEVIKEEKPTKITKDFLFKLRRVCLNKIKDYNDTLYHQEQAKKLSSNAKAFDGFEVVAGKFRLNF